LEVTDCVFSKYLCPYELTQNVNKISCNILHVWKITNAMEQSPSWRADLQSFNYSSNSPRFMGLEGSTDVHESSQLIPILG